MKMKTLLTCFLLLISSSITFSQYENVWVLGEQAGVDFSGGSPSVFTTPIGHRGLLESSASVCDANGNFLFFTNGNTVWDKNYDTMVNGHGLVSEQSFDVTHTTTQGALIVPMPDSANKYYIFSLATFGFDFDYSFEGELYYSIVDMSLNGGLGEIETGRKGLL